MIKKIEIENYKSIEQLSLEISRFNVFIGENGCGKTNILEAIAFASSYSDLDDGKLSLKGIRVSDPGYFRNGFHVDSISKDIKIKFFDEENNLTNFDFSNSNEAFSKWESKIVLNDKDFSDREIFSTDIKKFYEDTTKGYEDNILDPDEYITRLDEVIKRYNELAKGLDISISIMKFIMYAPENYFLRNYNIEGPYTKPLGTKGEGLLKLLKIIKEEKPEQFKDIFENMHFIDWFSDIKISEDALSGAEFKLSDKYLEDGIGGFDIRNANEGFFLVLFYITLFISDYTPSFFAIDNIDTALNPRLCTKLIQVLVGLAKKHNKEVIITTHNPSILDGLNLHDDEQRLFAVSRNKVGYTRLTRIEKKLPFEGEKSLKLSEQFLRGYIGGIPKNF